MARNEEKALSALNRWVGQKRDLERATNIGTKGIYMGGALPDQADFGPYAAKKRPKLSSEVNTVKECEIWRSEIVRGVAKKIAEIQNAALGEHRLRDLNDEINKDLREKGHWEEQIKALGGPDYKAQKAGADTVYGAELASHTGYKYFGAAKDLPGVRELFETEAVPEAPRKSRKQLFKNIQPDYYGWRDEEDALLLLQEQQMESQILAVEEEEYRKRGGDVAKMTEERAEKKSRTEFKAYVSLPSTEEIEKLLLAKKKEMLLQKYVTPEEAQRGAESKVLAAEK